MLDRTSARRSVSHSRADIIIVSPDGATGVAGLSAAVENYRAFMVRAKIVWFASRDHVVTERGDAAIVGYRWDMEWRSEGATHEATGREVQLLAGRDGARRIVWRTQLPGQVERPVETVRRRFRMRGVGSQDKAGAALFGKAPVCT